MKSVKVSFRNKKGDNLAASMELPVDSRPYTYALFAHCFTCSKDYKAVYNISRTLTLNGIAVLRFDFTGLGESEGDFSDAGFSSNVDDLVAAAEFMLSEFRAPSILIGHSLGGAAVLGAANRISSTEAVVAIAAPSSPSHLLRHFQQDIDKIKSKGEASVSIGGRDFTISDEFISDLETLDHQDTIKRLGKPLLIMHSPQDRIVLFENAERIFDLASHPKSLVSLDGADHLLSKAEDSIYAGGVIAEWARRYIELAEPKPLESELKVVAMTGESGYTTDIRAGGHGLVSDEPESVGGDDLGPSPYDLLLSALGACTSMTLRMYADRKEWDVTSIKVHLQHGKIHAKDCEECETDKGKIDRIERVIELEGNLDDDQKQRMLEIADRCPVHRTLHSEISVRTSLLKK